MIKYIKITIFLTIVASFIFLILPREYKWNEKLTVKFSTPSGDKQVSTVLTAHFVDHEIDLTTMRFKGSFYLTGEAGVAELLPTKYLFVTLRNMPSSYELYGSRAFDRSRNADSRIELKPRNYPQMVLFEDIKDPLSAKEVTAASIGDLLGRGFAIKSVTMELTDEPITTGKVIALLDERFWRHWANISNSHGGQYDYYDTFPSRLEREQFLAE